MDCIGPASCVERVSCKFWGGRGGELQEVDSTDFLQLTFARRKQKILYF